MSIESQLREDQVVAMKVRDKPKLNAIRSVQTEVATARSAPGFTGDVDDDFYVRTIATYVKRISKAKTEYDSMGEKGAEHSAAIAYEIGYLEQFLPQVLDEDATRDLVDRTIADLGADEDTPVGRVIGAVMQSGEDVDGALVSRLVREQLSSVG